MAPDPKPNFFRNQLVQALPAEDLAVLEPHLEHVVLPLRHPLETPNKPIQHVFFLDSGLASYVARANGGQKVEVGMVGREGLTGLGVVMGNDRSANECFIQGAGEGWRIASDDLRGIMQQRPSVRLLFLHYVQVFMLQASHTALANARAKLEERLARWLLMAQDRMDGNELPLKHDFLAMMLGVRRAGVTTAIHELEAEGLIRAKRGCIIVQDRAGLEETANGFYGTPEAEYERLMTEAKRQRR
jgi:CRP-like cAMP-binding protein